MHATPPGGRLLRVLRTAVKSSGIKQGAIERVLGMSKGYVSQLFSGRIELKISHLELILDAIGFDPQTFFRIVYPLPGEEGERAPAELPAPLRSAVEEVVRQALAAARPAAAERRRAKPVARRGRAAAKK